jgi:four helix bundle protein
MVLENLEVYQLSLVVGEKIWTIASKWDFFNKDTLGKQIVRSSDSISANIAEGFGRYFYKENRLFCYYSRGSLLETKCWLTKAEHRKLISSEEYVQLINELSSIHKKLNGYIKSIGTSSSSVSEPQESYPNDQ